MQNSSGFLVVVDHAALRLGTSRTHLRLRFLHLMELESFFGALTMERKASFAAPEVTGFLWSEWMTDLSQEKEHHTRI